MFFLFRKKERTKEKSIAFGLFSRRFILIRAFFRGLYIGKERLLSCAAFLAQSQRRLPGRGFAPHPALLSWALRGSARRVLLSQIVCARDVFTAAAAQRVIRGAART